MSQTPSAPPPSYGQATAYTNPKYPQSEGYPQGGGYPQGTNAAYPPPQPAGYNPANYNTNYSDVNRGYTPAPVTPFVPRMQAQVEPKPMDESEEFGITAYHGFSDKAIRRAFIKKVYLILMCQLSVTVGFISLFMFVDPLRYWVQHHSWFYYISYGTFIVTYIVLICIPSVRRKTPGNYICLTVFTLAFSYMTGTIASYYTTDSVLIAAGITALVCLSISLFAIQTKIDFTMCSGLLFVLCMVLFFFGWACLIVYMTSGYNKILDCVYGGLAALVFGLFLVYDTQMIVGGRKHELSPEEYIYGALQLYMDVVYIFLILLSCFGKSN